MEKVYYHLSDYVSHRVAGEAYMAAMERAGIALVDRPEAATTVILHDEPGHFERILANHPCMREARRIAYCVWETETLPPSYVRALQGVDAIWTCSEFSRAAFARHFSDVSVVPHVVAPWPVWEGDRESVKEKIGYRRDAYYFYTVADAVNPRKNLFGLIDVFLKNFLADASVYLVVKQYRCAVDLGGLKNVVSLAASLSYGEMFALHELCQCCLSLHHAEAWGLSLSEALSVGNPVIATGYSGNMTFMHAANSYPVNYVLGPVSEEMCRVVPLYTPAMRWAEPDPGHAGYLMRKVRRLGEDGQRRRLVAASMEPYSPARIGERIRALLA
jgi:glycosyltransferase involved in cell wall biosynthesis